MDIEKFTIKAQNALAAAQRIASDNANQQIEPEHLLLALLDDPESIVGTIIRKIGSDIDHLKEKMRDEVDKLPKVSGSAIGNVYLLDLLLKLDNILRCSYY